MTGCGGAVSSPHHKVGHLFHLRERERERGGKARERKKGENNRQGGGWLDLMPEAILFMFLWDGDVERREERGTF